MAQLKEGFWHYVRTSLIRIENQQALQTEKISQVCSATDIKNQRSS